MSDCLPGHIAMDSNSKCSSACISQLHRMDLFNKTDGCLGILMGYLWLSLHITYLDLAYLPVLFHFLHLKLLVLHLFCYKNIKTHNFL